MSVEIQQPEIEALIQRRMASGAFHDVEEVLIQALKSAPLPAASSATPFGKRLVDAFDEARKILDGVELDFARDPSPGRPVDLSCATVSCLIPMSRPNSSSQRLRHV